MDEKMSDGLLTLLLRSVADSTTGRADAKLPYQGQKPSRQTRPTGSVPKKKFESTIPANPRFIPYTGVSTEEGNLRVISNYLQRSTRDR